MNDAFDKNVIINVFKPEGITSQGVVTAVKRALGVKTAGHCGTLDPLATGVLPVMVERSVKASQYLVDHDKLYVAKMKLGVITDTGDITGNVIREFDGTLPTLKDVLAVLPRFIGEITQVPPMYSDLKVYGQKLCDLARKGVEIERKGRKITVYSLSAEEKNGEIFLRILCSRGTYIRTLIEDIGTELGCGATMAALCRSAVGNVLITNDRNLWFSDDYVGKTEERVFVPMFDEKNAVHLEDLKNGNIPSEAVVSIENVFSHYPPLTFSEFYERLFSNGCEIYVSKLEKNSIAKNAKIGDIFRIYGKNGFFALGEAMKYENGIAIKQIKRF